MGVLHSLPIRLYLLAERISCGAYRFALLSQLQPHAAGWHLRIDGSRLIVVGAVVELAAGFGPAHAAPLLEEERHPARAALVPKGANPFDRHRSGTMSTFAANDHPVNVSEIHFAQIFQKRFNGKESHRGRRGAKVFDSR